MSLETRQVDVPSPETDQVKGDDVSLGTLIG